MSMRSIIGGGDENHSVTMSKSMINFEGNEENV